MNPKHARKFNFNQKHSLAAAVAGREKKAKYLLKLSNEQKLKIYKVISLMYNGFFFLCEESNQFPLFKV